MYQQLRKKHRKKRRLLAGLRSAGVVVSDKPSACVLVANAGLTTGASLETIVARFPVECAPRSVSMVAGRQYCWLVFPCEAVAQRAVDAVDGVPGDPTLYLFFGDSSNLSLLIPEVAPQFSAPPGATLLVDFLSPAEESEILEQFQWSGEASSSMKHRQVLHFGHVFDYSTNGVNRTTVADPLPDWADRLISRLMSNGVLHAVPDQITVNRYLPGQGIPPHVDTHSAFCDQLVSVSLASDCTMEFSTPTERSRCLRLPRRSALMLDAEARYRWRHAIIARHNDITLTSSGQLTLTPRAERVSLTFRRLRESGYVCDCRFPDECDSQQGRSNTGSSVESSLSALQLERRFVADVYERIADHFSSTRHTAWPRVRQFVTSLAAADGFSVLLDVGCGNGKYLGLNERLYHVGLDQSEALCAIVCARGHQAVSARCLPLPVRSAVVDCVLCIAVLHHLASRERRREALKEIGRVMRVGARGLVYVWAREQRRAGKSARYLCPNREVTESAENRFSVENLPLPVHTNRTEFQQQDMLVPWKLQSSANNSNHQDDVHLRFYHVYQEGELEDDVRSVDGLSILESYYDQGNWCVVLHKDGAS